MPEKEQCKYILNYKHFKRIRLSNGKDKSIGEFDESENFNTWKEARERVQRLEQLSNYYDEYFEFYINGRRFYDIHIDM